MSQDHQSFHRADSLQRLLKLKRWEVPPPEHLDHLSARVIAQIEADAVKKTSIRIAVRELFDFKPLIACACCAAAMGLLVAGLGMKKRLVSSSNSLKIPLEKNLTIAGLASAKGSKKINPKAPPPDLRFGKGTIECHPQITTALILSIIF